MKSTFHNFSLNRKEGLFLIILLVSSLFLFSLNLGNHFLWQDEAQTALIAKTVLQYDVPKGYDGLNFLSQELGSEYGDNYIWKWHTWLPFYLLAAFFKVFGTTTFIARLPFALFGVGCLFLLYFFSRALFDDKKTAAAVVVVLLFSVPFLILSRQCRYYSLTAFFSIGALYGYHSMTKGRRNGAYAYFVFSTLLFHTHYVYLAALFSTIAVHTMLFHRSIWKKVLIVTASIIVVNMPWIYWLSDMKYADQYGKSTLNLTLSFLKLTSFLSQIRIHLFPVYLLLIPIGIGLFNYIKKENIQPWQEASFWNRVTLPLFFILFNLLFLSLVSPAPFFRYLSPIVPFLVIITGLLLRWAIRIHFTIGVGILAVMIYLSPFNNYLYELTHDFDGPIEGIVNYLNQHADKDDLVAITYGDMPLKFYTGLRVVGGLTGEDLEPARSADWIIIRRNVISNKDARVKQFLIQVLRKNKYESVSLDYSDTPFENRESPRHHLYKTNRKYPPVIIFKKVK
jgi:4-amino-4-deoxy-L-arabinose transferase-like glycosyltransferase